MTARAVAVALSALALLAGTAGSSASGNRPASSTPPAPAAGSSWARTPSAPTYPATTTSPSPHVTATRHALSVPFPERGPGMPDRGDYYTTDRTLYDSPWFAGPHRIMVPFGCTAAPYYDHDPRCPGIEGFHHGIDVAMPCGTPLYAAYQGQLLDAAAAGTLGPAYGTKAFLIRNHHLGLDMVLGHASALLVPSGTWVTIGTKVARSGQNGAPDGCHLHFEVRPIGASYTAAVFPRPYYHLTAAG